MKFALWFTYVSSFLLVVAIGVPQFANAASSEREATIEDVKKETQEFLQVLKSYSAAQRDEAIQKSREVMAKLDKRIETLETQIEKDWETMSKAARAEARESLTALHKQRNAVAEEYGRLREISADGWEQMKKGFAETYEDLQKAWEKTEKEFGAKN